MKKITIFCAMIALTSTLVAGGKIVYTEDSVAPVESSKFYIGAGLAVDSVSSYYYGTDTAYSGMFRMGYDVNDYIAIEARGTYGISDGDKLGHDYSYGLYLKPQYSVNEAITLYGLLGYAETKIVFDNEVSYNGIDNDYTTQSDVSFGIGLEYKIDKQRSATIDIVRYIDKSTDSISGKYSTKVDAASLGMLYRF